MMQERRKLIRRQADRELYERFRALHGVADTEAARAARHMLRRVIRHECQVQIALEIRHSAGGGDTWDVSPHPIAGRLLDLSETGCSLYTRDRLETGQTLRVLIAMPNAKKATAAGVVRWTKGMEEKGGYACGMQFSAISARDKGEIDAYIKRLDATAGL